MIHVVIEKVPGVGYVAHNVATGRREVVVGRIHPEIIIAQEPCSMGRPRRPSGCPCVPCAAGRSLAADGIALESAS